MCNVLRSAVRKYLPSLTFDNIYVPELSHVYADMLCHAVTLTFAPFALKVRGTSIVT